MKLKLNVATAATLPNRTYEANIERSLRARGFVPSDIDTSHTFRLNSRTMIVSVAFKGAKGFKNKLSGTVFLHVPVNGKRPGLEHLPVTLEYAQLNGKAPARQVKAVGLTAFIDKITALAEPLEPQGNGAEVQQSLIEALKAKKASARAEAGGIAFKFGKGLRGFLETTGAVFNVSFQHEDDGRPFLYKQFSTVKQLEKILDQVFANPVLNGSAKRLKNGVYWVKTGGVVRFKNANDSKLKDVKGQTWIVRPYGFDGGYLFTSEPKYMGQVEDMNMNCMDFETDKGQIVITSGEGED